MSDSNDRAALQSQAPDTVDALSYLKGLEAGQRVVLQSQDREDDPLQPAANWLIQAIESCTVADIQGRLSIGYNRAQRLFDHARRVEGDGE